MKGKQIRCPDCDSVVRIPAVIQEEGLAAVVPLPSVVVPKATQNKNLPGKGLASDSLEGQARLQMNATSKRLKPLAVASSSSDEEEAETLGFPKPELPKDDMDMTPMVDVTFLLLIFFMITASFTSEKVLEEPPPLSDSSTNAKEEPDKIQDTVRVQVDEFNAYTIILPGGEDRQASSKQDLIIALEDARKELVTGVNDNALKMAVEAHTESIHAAVVAAVDAAREKGFSSIQVTVVEEFD